MKNFLSNNKIRLQKYIADCGISSRRKAEIIINSGRVKVNGIITKDKSYKVNDNDIILLDEKLIKSQKKIYIVLNKPAGYLCAHGDKWGRKTIYDLIDIKDSKVFSLGRLDYETSGLIILTNDGEFANKIIHPSNKIIKEYYVKSAANIPDDLTSSFKNGIMIDEIKYKADDVIKIDNKTLKIFLNEGKKREIRNVFKKFGLNIKLLKRTALGNLRLDKLHIKEGEYKEFSHEEILKNIY